MEKFLQNLEEAEKLISAADHMVYVSFPLIKEKNLLLKALTQTKTSITSCINSILQFEYLYKRVSLYKDSKSNMRVFQERCAPKYGITRQELKQIMELLDLIEKHKKSHMEFMRGNKIIILSENSKTNTITLEKAKEFLILAKKILEKTKTQILA